MKKMFWKSNLGITFLLALFMLYSFVNLMLVKEMNIYYWMAFGVNLISVIGQTIFYEYSVYNNISVRTKFLKMPILVVGIAVTCTEILLTIIFNLTKCENMVIMISSQIVIIIGCVVSILASFIDRNDDNAEDSNDYIDTVADEIKKIEALTDDLNYKVLLHRLYDKVRLSEKTSPKEAENIEILINSKVVSLKKVSTKDDSDLFRKEVNELGRLIEDRNRICRLY